MEAGSKEIVRSLNRNCIYDTYFSLYRLFIRGKSLGGNVRGNMSGYRCSDFRLPPHSDYPLGSLKSISGHRGGNLNSISDYPLRVQITPALFSHEIRVLAVV